MNETASSRGSVHVESNLPFWKLEMISASSVTDSTVVKASSSKIVVLRLMPQGFASKNARAKPGGVALRNLARSGLGDSFHILLPSVGATGLLVGKLKLPQSSVFFV